MIVCTARDYIVPEHIPAYLSLVRELVSETRKEPGNLSYVHFEDCDHPGEYLLIEQWRDENALKLHFASPHFTSIVPQIQPMQSKPSQVNTYRKAE